MNHIDIIAVTYGHNDSLKCFINSIKAQTCDNWKLFIVHDGPNKQLHNELNFENYLNDRVIFIQHPVNLGFYGHPLRKWALENLNLNNRVLITNADNYYVPVMVEEVLKRREELIYFDLIHSHNTDSNLNKSSYGFMCSELKRKFIDIGCVVMDSNLAKKVSFDSLEFAADWFYFEKILHLSPTTHKINKVLFVHN